MITPEMLASRNTEHGHQAALMCWSQQNLDKYPELKWLTAIPNGGYRDKITAAKLKAEGVKSGVPDLCLLIKRGMYAALWIELKRPASEGKKVGIVSSSQNEWIDHLITQDHAACICYGWEMARNMIIDYLEWK